MASHKHQTLIEAIKNDHQEVYEYYDQYVKASGNPDAQERWARQLTWEIARHAVEEIVVYPLMESHLGDKGVELADQDRADHQTVKNQLYELESLTAGSDDHANLLKSIMAHLHEHNDNEEKDLPLLEPALGKEGSLEAATTFMRTKQFAPTRAHPSVFNKPPFETIAGLLEASLDKLKDMFSKFPTEEMRALTIVVMSKHPLNRGTSHRVFQRPIVPRTLLFARTMASHKHQTLIEAIKDDHQEMYEYYDQYVKASGNPDAQERWARQLTWEIARHAVGEEIVVYPLMESHLGDKGVELADQDRADHQTVKNQLYELESLTAGSDDHANLLKSIMAHLHEHNDNEEMKDLPLLEPTLGKEGSLEAATTFMRTKQFAPTRAHPSAPNKPPFETIVGLLGAPLDKLKDMFSKFPTEEMRARAK